MKLNNLIREIPIKDIIARIPELYPNLDAEPYKQVIGKLLKITPEKSDMQISIEKQEPYDGGDSFYDVRGIKSGTNETFAIEYSKWKEWLGMEIFEETISKYSKLDIVCHCLWEMTFHGYNEEDVVTAREELQSRLDNLPAFFNEDIDAYLKVVEEKYINPPAPADSIVEDLDTIDTLHSLLSEAVEILGKISVNFLETDQETAETLERVRGFIGKQNYSSEEVLNNLRKRKEDEPN